MDTNVEALKGLYVVLGGNIDDVEDITLISDMITEIAKVASTSGDAGGQILTATFNSETSNYELPDYDYAQLKEDAEAGKIIGIKAVDSDETRFFTIKQITASAVIFQYMDVARIYVRQFIISYEAELNGGTATNSYNPA